MRYPKVDALRLASIVAGFEPRGISVELVAEDRIGIREQLASYLAQVLVDEFGLDKEDAERFYRNATSHLIAERVTPERMEELEQAAGHEEWSR